MSSNENLHRAKKEKNDEFYTRITDVEKEMYYYKEQFKGKTVFCNCDDPAWSAFWQYFALNFKHLGLKRLVSTHYKQGGQSYRLDISEYGQETLPIPLNGDGDFRSDECLAILDECDIVCTNPPFSLFREYIATLMEHGKKFIVLGSMNAITYKEIFPLIKENRLWLGPSACNGAKVYIGPNGEEHKMGNTMWFTNMDHKQRHEPLVLYKSYTPSEYPKYDNYDAIEVSKTAEIPADYSGAMGVPISFLDKYCPEQFDILNCNDYRKDGFDKIKPHGLIKDKDSEINGKPTYARILIKIKQKGAR